MKNSRSIHALLLLCLIYGSVLPVRSASPANDFAKLTKGSIVHGFRTDAVYLDDGDREIGGRFVHEKTGFTVDLLNIQSVPQAYIYANTFTVSDMGEPHTQEHLLILKGNKGRNINVAEGMSLTESTASTYQTYTDYAFNTAGGSEVFYQRFANYMDVLLHPDYTDEEVAREVRNWGVAESDDKSLKLEEKGSVYNEMVSSMNNPDWRLYDNSLRMLYGAAHPFSFNAGGSPEGIRLMTAADIKKYHDANYHLANMGAVISVPKDMTLDAVLTRLDTTLNQAEPKSEKRNYPSPNSLPQPHPATVGTIKTIDFPSEDVKQPASILFSLPATLKPDLTERTLLAVFINVFAGDANTNLYKKFIDSKTREIDTGAKGIQSWVQGDSAGAPVFINLGDVSADKLTEDNARQIQQKIREEFVKIANFRDGSPELREFNDRFKNALTDYRRTLSKFVNTPPGFGFRNGGNGDGWLWQLRYLNGEGDFKKSVTLKPELAKVEAMLASGMNLWRDYLPKWGYTTNPAYAAVAHPSQKLLGTEESERKARAAAEVDVLKKRFNVTDDQEAIRKYKAAYDATTAGLERLEQGISGHFLDDPPLTLDAQIDYRETKVGTVKVGNSIFDNMTGATSGVAFRLDSVPEKDLVYVSALPLLLRSTGVIRNGKALSYEEMSELLRKEILSLSSDFAVSYVHDRYELVVRGAGNDEPESARAVEWMGLILKNPNWTEANLPRIRDVVDQQFGATRRRMQDAEETWVTNPSDAFLNQSKPLFLTTASFLTQAHNLFRLRWMLKDKGDAANAAAIDKFLTNLTAAKGNRDELQLLTNALQGDKEAAGKLPTSLKGYTEELAKLPDGARSIATESAKDLGLLMTDIPDSSLATDWATLCSEMRAGLAQGPAKTLSDLSAVRKRILNTNGARMFYIGSTATRQKLDANYSSLLAGLDSTTPSKPQYSSGRLIDERVTDRLGAKERPVYVGLMAPNMPTGVIINSAPVAGYADFANREKVLDFLASKLYGGGGPHSVFSKTVASGLAYSNGVGSSPESGRISYYAERTPLLPQTLGFVVTEVKRPLNTSLTDYVTALCFSSRASSPYEIRGEAMAANMTDGVTPEVVSNFRKAILEARKTPNLSDELFRRKDAIYQRVLPGYGAKGRDVPDGSFFVIGAEKQLSAYEAYLKNSDGPDTRLYRLYPRDFWMVGTR